MKPPFGTVVRIDRRVHVIGGRLAKVVRTSKRIESCLIAVRLVRPLFPARDNKNRAWLVSDQMVKEVK